MVVSGNGGVGGLMGNENIHNSSARAGSDDGAMVTVVSVWW